MARAMARQDFSQHHRTVPTTRKANNLREVDDLWPEEPTSVEAAMTMEEMLLEEMRRQGELPPANDPSKKGTRLR
jgi:hypothetical protein